MTRFGGIGALLLALALTGFTPTQTLAQTTCGTYAVAVAPQPVGHPLTDNIIRLVDGSGEIGRVSVAQPGSVTPSPRAGVALVRSLASVYSLLDIATGSVTPIQIPEDQQVSMQSYAPTIHNASSADFMLLANVPTATWLVDLRSGQAIDLTTLLPDGGFVESAAIAPGGKWAEFYSDNAAYLLSLETPADPISISEGDVLRFPGFDQQGDALIYATKSDEGVEVRSYDLASGSSDVVGETASADVMEATISNAILLVDKQQLLALTDELTDPVELFTWQGAISGLIGDTNGRHLLIGDQQNDVVSWSWVDVETGATVALADLTGMTPLTNTRRQDAIVFLPSARQGPGTPGDIYRTFDMETGHVTTALTQDSAEVWTYALAGDDAGRYVLIDAVSPGEGRMWLIDAQGGTATQIGTSSGNVNARVSPDGCQLAVSVFDTVGEGRTSSVSVTSLVDGSSIATAADSILLGWAETGRSA